MKIRNKLLTQLLIVSEEYDLDIINIYFRDINSIMEEVEIIFKNEHNKFIIKYSYEKDDIYEINSFVNYFRNELDKIKKED